MSEKAAERRRRRAPAHVEIGVQSDLWSALPLLPGFSRWSLPWSTPAPAPAPASNPIPSDLPVSAVLREVQQKLEIERKYDAAARAWNARNGSLTTSKNEETVRKWYDADLNQYAHHFMSADVRKQSLRHQPDTPCDDTGWALFPDETSPNFKRQGWGHIVLVRKTRLPDFDPYPAEADKPGPVFKTNNDTETDKQIKELSLEKFDPNSPEYYGLLDATRNLTFQDPQAREPVDLDPADLGHLAIVFEDPLADPSSPDKRPVYTFGLYPAEPKDEMDMFSPATTAYVEFPDQMLSKRIDGSGTETRMSASDLANTVQILATFPITHNDVFKVRKLLVAYSKLPGRPSWNKLRGRLYGKPTYHILSGMKPQRFEAQVSVLMGLIAAASYRHHSDAIPKILPLAVLVYARVAFQLPKGTTASSTDNCATWALEFVPQANLECPEGIPIRCVPKGDAGWLEPVPSWIVAMDAFCLAQTSLTEPKLKKSIGRLAHYVRTSIEGIQNAAPDRLQQVKTYVRLIESKVVDFLSVFPEPFLL